MNPYRKEAALGFAVLALPGPEWTPLLIAVGWILHAGWIFSTTGKRFEPLRRHGIRESA